MTKVTAIGLFVAFAGAAMIPNLIHAPLWFYFVLATIWGISCSIVVQYIKERLP